MSVYRRRAGKFWSAEAARCRSTKIGGGGAAGKVFLRFPKNCILSSKFSDDLLFTHPSKNRQKINTTTMASAARRQIIGGAPITKNRRQRRPQSGGGAAGVGLYAYTVLFVGPNGLITLRSVSSKIKRKC